MIFMKIRVFLGGSDFLRIGTARRKEKIPSPTHAEVRSRSGPKKPFGSGAARSRDDRGAVKVFFARETPAQNRRRFDFPAIFRGRNSGISSSRRTGVYRVVPGLTDPNRITTVGSSSAGWK